MPLGDLPLKGSPAPVYRLALVAAGWMSMLSLAGLLLPEIMYPNQSLRLAFFPNDLVNLALGLPVLLALVWSARRGSWVGLLCLPGALLYVCYNAVACTAGLAFGWQALLHLGLLALSAAGAYQLVRRLDAPALRQRLYGAVAERFGGLALAFFAVLFFVLRAGVLAQALGGQGASPVDGAVALADLLISPLWLAGGVLLFRRRASGYAAGLGLLFNASLLFAGLLVLFLLQPVVNRTPFPAADFIIVAAMGMLFFAPMGLFLRGVRARAS